MSANPLMTQSGHSGISGSENYAGVCNSFYHCDRSGILLQPYLVAACALFGFASGMKRKCRLRSAVYNDRTRLE